MVSLDDPVALRRADEHGMLGLYLGWADAILDALKRAEQARLPAELRTRRGVVRYEKPSAVVVVGMGGSAIGGDLLRDLLWDRLEVPIEVCRDYHLPAWVKAGSLVVAISYSGNTEETLTAFSEALGRGCMVMAITSGGILGQLCRRLGAPLVEVPKGYPPRAALPYLFMPLLVLMERLGLASGLIEQARRAADTLRRMAGELGPDVPAEQNEAKKLALEILGTIPVVYGFGRFRSVAYRLKTQFNENSKMPSFANWFPALNHDEIVGWEGEEALTKTLSVLLIRSRDEPPEVRRRIELTRRIALHKASKILEIWARGSEPLEQMLSALYVGELATLYLALARDVSPYEIASINALKAGMAELGLAEKARRAAEALLLG